MVVVSSPVAVIETSDYAPVSSKEFLDIQATIECGFFLKRVRDMTRTYSLNKTSLVSVLKSQENLLLNQCYNHSGNSLQEAPHKSRKKQRSGLVAKDEERFQNSC